MHDARVKYNARHYGTDGALIRRVYVQLHSSSYHSHRENKILILQTGRRNFGRPTERPKGKAQC